MTELRLVTNADQLDFSKMAETESGLLLIPATVVNGAELATRGLGAVLMQGWMNGLAVERTLELGLVTFMSRSQGELWTKGMTSGNTLELIGMYTDCDQDSLLIDARPSGPTCHTGAVSCFQEPELTMYNGD